MKAIIFGINGQDGYYLTGLLNRKSIDVIGISRSKGNWLTGDIGNTGLVEDLIKKHKALFVFNLAANSTTRIEAMFENHLSISTGALNILESVKKYSPETKVFLPGSGVQFYNTGKPIKESDAFDANSAYSVSRIQSVYAARYFRSLGINVYTGYLFHHESPLRKPIHISKMIVDTLLRIRDGSKEKIELGDITVEKEWAFAKDICEGILTLMDQDNVFEACIGTGKTHSIKEWLEVCFGHFGMDWENHVVYKNSFSPEYNRLVSDPATINSLGWEAKTTLKELSEIMINSKY